MYQAIRTRYVGPTNHRPGRVIASAAPGKIITSWDHDLGVVDNHVAAAKAFAEKYEWFGRWFGGSLDNAGYVFVLVDSTSTEPAFEVAEKV